ncbi:MAG: nucleotide sugar dehydrogenase [Luteolibacter sp.]|uniref:nucleotide sugar dehydrogenase n=2 Tax=Luteolibacter sp. TaxID=1962973 RepID=UPI003266CC73
MTQNTEAGQTTRDDQVGTRVAIIGMGYVGLPLALQFVRSGTRVLGIDVDESKVDRLNGGQSYIKHISSEDIGEARRDQRFSATTDFSEIADVAAVIICVPTPLSKNRDPDISYVLDTGRAMAPHLRKGTLIALESTTYPGTTDENLRAVLEEGSGMVAGVDFHLAYSPEREDPGNPASKVGEVPKLVGGLTPACLELALAVYGRAVKNLVPVSSCRVAEAAKLLENIFRSVNIALVNELKIVYAAMGIDIWEVIAAAKTKPFGFMPFYPGPGLGGHCIPIDPFYLTWKAHEFECATRFIELAGEINTSMPGYVVERIAEALNDAKKPLNGSRILVLGLAYKPNVDDERESPSYRIMELLKRKGGEVFYHDPFVPVIGQTREHSEWAGTPSVEWNRETISGFDLVVISTAHTCINYAELAEWAACIVDTRNVMSEFQSSRGRIWKA